MLLTTTAAAKMLGITHQSLSKGAKAGRFTVAQRKPSGRPLFDSDVIRREYEDTREMAELQDHARFLREALADEPEEVLTLSEVWEIHVERAAVTMGAFKRWTRRVSPSILGARFTSAEAVRLFLDAELELVWRELFADSHFDSLFEGAE